MRQQINLYQDVLIDKQEPLQRRQVFLIIGLFVGLLALLSLYSFWQLNTNNQQLTTVEAKRDEKLTQLEVLEKKYPERVKSVLLEEELSRVEQSLLDHKQLLNYFSVRKDGGNTEILDVLTGLASHRHPGVWLKRIQLSGDGQDVQLAGVALKPEQVPAYVHSLGENKVLNGQVFDSLKLVRMQKDVDLVEFSLESNLEESR